jgi:hypothetical protein
VTLMFPKANKCLLQDIVRIGLAPGPLARDQPEPGAVFGEPGPPVLAGMGIVHVQVIKGAARRAVSVCYPSDSGRGAKIVKAVAKRPLPF